MPLNDRRAEWAGLVIATAVMDAVTTALILVCWSGSHDPLLWISAACSFALFCGLLILQFPVQSSMQPLYGFLSLSVVGVWFLFDEGPVSVSRECLALLIPLTIFVALLWRNQRRSKKECA
jgi:hypothetical protein